MITRFHSSTNYDSTQHKNIDFTKVLPPPPPFPLLQWFSLMKSSKKHVSNILFDLRRFLIQYNKTGYQLSNLCFYIILMITIILRVPDCNFRESLAKLEKSKLLIICLKFTFGELSSKTSFECSGNL